MKKKFIYFIKQESSGWSHFDLIWLALSSVVIIGVSLSLGDTAIGIVSALTGVWYTLFAGNGKRSCFIFGTVNALLYAYISFKARFYGEVMLNLIYYFPMNFVGWLLWSKHRDSSTGELEKRRMGKRESVVTYGITAAGIIAYGAVLRLINGSLPFVDSFTTVLSVTAQLLTVRRFTEQWILWIAVNTVSVAMWAVNFSAGQENISVLIMWALYLANAVIMYARWSRETGRKRV